MLRLPLPGGAVRGARGPRLPPVLAASVVVLAVGASPALGQEAMGDEQKGGPEVTVRVRQVAGTGVYLDVGRIHGFATGDTLPVLRAGEATPVGALVVTASSERRCVLTFVGAPFPVTGGEILTFHLRRQPTEWPQSEPPARPTPPTTPSRRPPSLETSERSESGDQVGRPVPLPAHGRYGLDLSAVHSSTRFGDPDPDQIERTFATPALRIDATVPEAVGGFRLVTSLRTAYRYSDTDVVSPAGSIRVYTASLARTFTSVPLRLALGRFRSPVEDFSGYWDGIMVRFGGDALGVGALVGLQPDRWNERPSTELPKASVFLDWQREGPDWRWRGDVSAHTVRPTSDLPNHTFLGLGQRITAGRLALGQELQVDRDPGDGRWRLSDLRLRGTVELSRRLDLRLGLARRESYRVWRGDAPFSPRMDRVSAGLGWRLGRGYLGVDVSGNRAPGTGRDTWSWTGTVSVPGLPGLPGVTGTGSVSRWAGSFGNVLSAAPGITFPVAGVPVRAGYRFQRAFFLRRTTVTHGLDLATDLELADGLRASMRLGGSWGGTLRSQTLQVSLYRIF